MNIIMSVILCSGFWVVVNTITANYLENKRRKESNHDALSQGVRGLLYGELEKRLTDILSRGKTTISEINSIRKYYYQPYIELGGDGLIQSLYEKVEELPIEKN